jgi:hypothetical protein
MTSNAGANARITETVLGWPGTHAEFGRRGEWSFRVGAREIGHLHGDRAAHFAFPADVAAELRSAERVGDHPVFPGHPKLAARAIRDDVDERDVLELLRGNYERLIARFGVPDAVA